ncbi:MAG: twin-arginine translocation signal domain-containing protein, partial [Pseudomonadota bacterium]
MTNSSDAKTVSRRKFLKGGAIAAGTATAGTIAMPNVSRAQTTTLKMQTSWGATSVFQDMARQYVERCEKMSGGRLKFDLLPAGAIVKAFQVQNACSDGLIDCTHTVTAYWYGKHKAASLFGTGPVFGCDASQMLAWVQ